ncbi:MAG TPA: serine/threonine-protein kinase, partial [Gemmataceae bacterium]|nr:serine/threonine-protein kinase [Gemmataceae bacterium]
VPGYEILGEIGRGGMAVVYRVRCLTLDREMAIKTPRPELATRPDIVRRFMQEVQITAQLPHPGVVPVYEIGEADGQPYMVMELIQGRTLADILKGRPAPAGDLPRFLQLFERVCQAVGYAHSQGVIHRSLKPHDVMIDESGRVKVIDWGLAIGVTDLGVSRDTDGPGPVLGSPSYMPPEQARGDTDLVNYWSDVFGLGGILCEILTGHPPFTGRSIPQIVAAAAAGDLSSACARLDACGADRRLIALCKRCLAPDPADRFADASAVAAAVAAYRAGIT